MTYRVVLEILPLVMWDIEMRTQQFLGEIGIDITNYNTNK